MYKLTVEQDDKGSCGSLEGEEVALNNVTGYEGHVCLIGDRAFVAFMNGRLIKQVKLREVEEAYCDVLNERRILYESLTRVQKRCTELALDNRSLKREPGERFVESCGECPAAWYSEIGDETLCKFREDIECLSEEVPAECPLKYQPVTLRVSDG